jgi:excisionase family DNA binding protein
MQRSPRPVTLPYLLCERELAEILGVSLPTLRRWRFRQEGPAWVKLGRLCRYPLDRLQEWLSDHDKSGARNSHRGN